MKMKTLVAVTVIAASGLTMWAQDSTTSVTQTTTVDSTATPDQLYNANEFSLDLFGTVSVNQETINNISGNRVRHNGRLGAGAGLTYYATRYVGIGGDAYSENTDIALWMTPRAIFIFAFRWMRFIWLPTFTAAAGINLIRLTHGSARRAGAWTFA